MFNLYTLLNHQLTTEQHNNIISFFNSEAVITSPPAVVSDYWCNVNPNGSLSDTGISTVFDWLKTISKDSAIIVQGEYGATYMVVDWCIKNGIAVYYITTNRNADEQTNTDGSSTITRIFRHAGLRKYEPYEA